MAYRHYHTTGFVLGHHASGEANKLYQIITSDFGLIRVLAQGVRLEKSKLRYNLQNYHLVNVDMVRGREYWRLTGAEKLKSANFLQVAFCRKLSSIVLRLVHGEDAGSFIFSDLKKAWDLLEQKPQESNFEDLEIFILVRLLYDLGYLASSDLMSSILTPEDFTWSDVGSVVDKRAALIKVINASFLASGL